jgi:hypothetical protein
MGICREKHEVVVRHRYPLPFLASSKSKPAPDTDFIVAYAAAFKDSQARKYGKGHGGKGRIPCPICRTVGRDGVLVYLVSSYSGHLRGQCTEDGCVNWEE